jgi:chromosome segregation ATPase
MQHTNLTQAINELKAEIQKELTELRAIEEEIRAHETKQRELKAKIPQHQKEIEAEKHELWVVESELPKLKQQLAQIQREKLAKQNELTSAAKAYQDDVREHSQVKKAA